MARLDPIQYAERLYGAICAANFSPISFLAFGNAVKDGVAMRNMPRIAVEPFMRVVGCMLDLEEDTAINVIEAATKLPEQTLRQPDVAAGRQHRPEEPEPAAAGETDSSSAQRSPNGANTKPARTQRSQ